MFLTFEFRVPEKVRMLLTPVIQSEMQLAIKDQKLALDSAMLAVHVIFLLSIF